MRHLASVQALRGFAAISVVFYHVYIILLQPEYGGRDVFGTVARHGLLGVNFFFILSGFIMLLAHQSGLGNPANLKSYLIKRFVRIYPVYWIFLIAYISAAALGLGHPDFSWSPVNLLSAFTLVEISPPTTLPLKIAWTLVYEVRFYVVFAILFLSVPLGILVLTIWMASVTIASATGLEDQWEILSAWNVYFMFGMGVFYVSRKLSDWAGVPLLLAGLAMLIAYFFNFNLNMSELKSQDDYVIVFLAFAFSLIIVGFVLNEDSLSILSFRPFQILGDASYSIYIVHSAVISAIVLIVSKFGLMWQFDPRVLFFVLFLSGVIVGVVVHFLVERPLLSLLRSRRGRTVGSD